jgi:putative ABC transport system permease protein
MFINYLKVALRNIKRYKGFSFINISGLAVGMACCILIFLWVQDELSYDKFHENGKNLYLVGTHERYGTKTVTHSGTPSAVGPALKADYPEIVNAARICNGPHTLNFAYGDKRFREEVEAVDPSFLEMFTFPLIKGNPATALSDLHSVVLTQRTTYKYFGTDDPIGKVIRVENRYDFLVTGVLANLPHNSIIQFDFLIPIEFLREHWNYPQLLGQWSDFSFTTYVQLQENASYEEISHKISGRITRENREFEGDSFLWPFTRLYLYSLGTGGGRIAMVHMLSLIAVFILLIACINFMNLTTARSGNRAKEIGMRKVTGAYRVDIIKQFYGESILMAFLSLFMAILLVVVLLPVFNQFTAKALNFDIFRTPVLLLGLPGAALLTGLMAGSYPALFMSYFQPVEIIKGVKGVGSKGAAFRKVLVVLQFAVCLILIIRTFVAYNQLNYMRNKDLGFNRDHLVYIPISGALEKHYQAAKQELLKIPGIVKVSLTSRTPLGFYSGGSGWEWEGKRPDVNPHIRYFCCDHDFVKTFEIEMAQGQFFSGELTNTDSIKAGQLVINEELARIIGKNNSVGTRISYKTQQLRIIGVIKNFNYWPLYHHSGPLMVFYKTYHSTGEPRYRYIFARLSPENIPKTITAAKQVITKMNPGFPFTYHFLDEDYDHLYRSEEQAGTIFQNFALLAILISCLGLFGLSSFMAEQRTREIGIRKVMGSSVQGIVLLLSKEFMKWVVMANIIAWPTAWWISHNWLRKFAYRTSIDPGIFVLSTILTLIIALVTVSYQSIKVALANPVDSLRSE